MSEGVNKVILLGNIGADPELRVTQQGTAVLKLRLATTETYLDSNNTRQERTEWHQCTLWGKRGESLSKHLKKGDRIYVEGGLRTTSYEKNGEKRYSTEVNVTDVKFAGSKREGGESQPRGQQERKPAASDGFDDFGGGPRDEGGEIPF